MIARYFSAFGGSLAFHAGVIAILIWLTRADLPRLAVDAPPPSAMPVFVVPPEDTTYPGLKPIDRTRKDRLPALDAESSAISIQGFKFDALKISERAHVLFPFVSPGVSLDHFALHGTRDGTVVLRNPLARPREARKNDGAPLVMSDAAIDALTDKTWSRRERWAAFEPIRALIERHAADAGSLPAVVRRYTDRNALQPYQDMGIRDPRLWTQLGLAADHVSFIALIRQYASDNPGTRTTTELLFLLDRIAEASRDALAVLLDTDPETDLRWTWRSNPAAHALAVELRRHYRAELTRLGLTTGDRITRYYDGVRLSILEGILRTTPDGYRANDARFLIGAIHWGDGKRAEALQAWQQVSDDVPGETYAAASAQLADTLRRSKTGQMAPHEVARHVDRILKIEHGRWWDLSYDRLRRFGFKFDTY
jgi:hypothetical protein